MLPEILNKLVNREDLSELEMFKLMNQIMDGELTPAQMVRSYGLRMKGETAPK